MYLTFFVTFLIAVAGTLFALQGEQRSTALPQDSIGLQMGIWHSAALQAAARDSTLGDTTTAESVTQTQIMTAPALLPDSYRISGASIGLPWQTVAFCPTPCTRRIVVSYVVPQLTATTPVPNAGGYTLNQISDMVAQQMGFGSAYGSATGADGARQVLAEYVDGGTAITVTYPLPDVVSVGSLVLVSETGI